MERSRGLRNPHPDPGADIPNPALPWTILGCCQLVLVMWVALIIVCLLSFRQSPLEGWANFPSRLVTSLGVVWLLFAGVGAGAMLAYANAPPLLRIGPDFVECTPPRRYAGHGELRHLFIQFEMIRSIGWTVYGPTVIWNKKGPPGFGVLVTWQNARLLRDRWLEWKAFPPPVFP